MKKVGMKHAGTDKKAAGGRAVRKDSLAGKLSRSATFMVSLPMLGSLALVAVVWDFIIFALNANFFLNMGILLVLFIAVGIALMRGRAIDAEMAVLRQGFSIAEKRIDGSLDALPRNISGSMFIRLNRVGLSDGAHLPDSSIESELATMRQEFEQLLEGLNYLVGLLIALGLLGTFIGLLETLIKAGDVLNVIGRGSPGPAEGGEITGMFSQMVGALKGPLTAMGTAFSASMFGLVGSIIAGLMVVLLRRSFEAVVRRARFGLVQLADKTVLSVKPVANVTEEFLARFLTGLTEHNSRAARMLGDILEESARTYPAVSQSIAAVQLLAGRVERQNEMLARLPETLERLERLPEAIDASTQQLVRLNAMIASQEQALDALGGRLQAQAAAQAEQMGGLRAGVDAQLGVLRSIESSNAPSLEASRRIASSLSAIEAAQKPAQQVSALIVDSLRGIEATQQPLLEAATRIGAQLDTVSRDNGMRFEKGLAMIQSIREPLAETMQSVSNSARQSAEASMGVLGYVPSAVARLESGLAGIQERLAREEEVLRAQADLLRNGTDNEDKRAASLRLLGDAMLASAGSVDGVRHEVALMVRGQRQVTAQLTDTLKGIEVALGRMQEVFESQRLALRTMQAPVGGDGNGDGGGDVAR